MFSTWANGMRYVCVCAHVYIYVCVCASVCERVSTSVNSFVTELCKMKSKPLTEYAVVA